MRSTVVAFWGAAFLSARIPLWLSCLHCVGLQHFGERERLLAAAGSGKSGCPSCFADDSERGVSPRLEVGGSACFALALLSPGWGCFCLRLDFQVTVSVRGGVKGVNPGFLVLAFSARTLKSNGVPARGVPAGGMLPLVCSTPACAGLLVVVRFSCVHRCCFLGCCFHLSKDPLGVKLSPVLACSTSGSGRGFRSRLLARVLPGVGAGSEARGEGRLFLRMRLRLLYSVCVVICWGRARRAPGGAKL